MAENNIHTDGQNFWVQSSQFFCMCSQFVYTRSGFIREIGQWGSSGPCSVILGGPFLRKGVPQKVFELIGTDCFMRKQTLIDVLPPFWNILGNWKGQAQMTSESRMFVWWNNDSNEDKKGNWDSKMLLKFKVRL